jgi:hypothetical protein
VGLGRPGSPDPGSYEETRELARIEAALRTLHEPGGSRSIFRRLIPASEAFAGPFAKPTVPEEAPESSPDAHDSEDPAASGEASRELKESLRALGYVEE